MDLKRLGNFLGRFFCAISPGTDPGSGAGDIFFHGCYTVKFILF